MRDNHTKMLCLLAVVTGPLGCQGTSNGGAGDNVGTVHAALNARSVHDVASVVYTVVNQGDDCTTPPVAAERSFLATDGLPSILQPPGGGDSRSFTDAFFDLPAGNYTVCATPLQIDSSPSAACPQASQDVSIAESESTELLFVPRCLGEESGASDDGTVVSAPSTVAPIAQDRYFVTHKDVTADAPDGDQLAHAWERDWNSLSDTTSLFSSALGDDGIDTVLPVVESLAPCPFAQTSYDASATLPTFSLSPSVFFVGLAYDGVRTWSGLAQNAGGLNLVRYSPISINIFATPLNFRSVFTKTDGTSPLYAREFGSRQIRVQTSPGVFGNDVVLVDGVLNNQASVVFNGAGTEFVSMIDGTVSRWTDAGAFIGAVPLAGFGTLNSEDTFPQDRRVLERGGYYLTYSNQILSAWDSAGERVCTTTLNDAGTLFESHFTLSYANGKVWVVDFSGAPWRGYDVGL